ncbi:MAG: hypothetical protein K1W35_22935 [Lachnospiraceae bacterium]
MDFPFDDAPNTAVITCCHILDHGAPILHVSHDADDGMWQFLCGACHDESEGRIVSLHYIYTHNSTVAQIARMPCGCMADRETAGRNWDIQREI